MAFPTEDQGFGPINQPGGGDGGYTKNDYPLGVPPTPSITVLRGFSGTGDNVGHGVHTYVLNETAEHFFTQKMWDDSFFSSITNNKYNPLQGILGYFYLPDYISRTTDTATNDELLITKADSVRVNGYPYLETEISTGSAVVSELKTHYYWKRFGELNINEYFGTFMDYAPYTKIQLYLPFIGIQEIPTNLCMGGKIELDYLINALDGNCVAYITTIDRNENERTIISATGNCALQKPISGHVDMTAVNVISAIGQTVIQVATTAMGMPLVGAAANAAVNTATSALSQQGMKPIDFTNNVTYAQGMMAYNSAKQNLADAQKYQTATMNAQKVGLGGAVLGGATQIAGAALTTPSSTSLAGAVSGGMGIMNQLIPYVSIFRPVPCTPYNYNHLFGRPSNVTGNISDFHGFNIFGAVNVGVSKATSGENAEIKQLLMSGVILADKPPEENE